MSSPLFFSVEARKWGVNAFFGASAGFSRKAGETGASSPRGPREVLAVCLNFGILFCGDRSAGGGLSWLILRAVGSGFGGAPHELGVLKDSLAFASHDAEDGPRGAQAGDDED
jgi:hypothetical protein